MCAQKVLVVDEDATGRIAGETLQLEGFVVRYERDRRKAIDLLMKLKEPHLVFIRYMPPHWVGFDWSALLARRPRLQRHAYVEICRCPLRKSACEQWEVRERFSIPVLPCPFTLDDVLTEAARAIDRLTLR